MVWSSHMGDSAIILDTLLRSSCFTEIKNISIDIHEKLTKNINKI